KQHLVNIEQWYCLSYTFNSRRKFYKDNKGFLNNQERYSGRLINRETEISLNSHMNTHIDFPAHCVKSGKFGEEYPLNFFHSQNVSMVFFDLTKEEIPELTCKYFHKNITILNQVEILLINTNFHTLRDDKRYIWNSPIISRQLPLFLKNQFPKLKIVGFDIISLTSQLNRNEGKMCHFNFLSRKGGREILVIEDMYFGNLKKDAIINEIFIAPFYYEKMDGALCTVMVKCEGRK
ncbi:cyclase, partial [Campylobacter coli]|nr:cyclase [Campylobacter coli]ELN9602964.1 cyclase family protein [Campylobacter coli]